MDTLAINRRFLYTGLFLVAIGGVLVTVDLLAIGSSTLSSALRLWPVALVAIGAAIVLRRSRYALVAGTMAAMVPGLVLGGGLALAPRHGLDCAADGASAETSTQQGTFTGPAGVQVDSSCGSISIGTQPGSDWQLTSSVASRQPDVEFANGLLQVASTGADWFDGGRDTWQLTLPTTTPLEHLRVTVDAGRASLALPDANIGNLILTGTGAEIVADASSAKLVQLDGSIDFGRMSIRLPEQTSLSGAIHVGAGMLELCAPPGSLLLADFAGTPREVRVNGLRTDASEWQSDNALSPYRIELRIKVNFGTVAINPIGGCK